MGGGGGWGGGTQRLTQHVNSQGKPLCQAIEQHLSNSRMVEKEM